MNDRYFNDLLADLLEDGPTEAPDRLLQAVAGDLPRIRQRGGLRASLGRTFMTSNPLFRPAAAVVAVLILAGVAFALWNGGGSNIGGNPPATASPSPGTSGEGSAPRLPEPFGLARNGLVAYEADGDIFVVDPSTGEARPIVVGATIDFEPIWSRDGSRLAFLREMTGGGVALFAVDPDGSDPLQFTRGSLQEVSNIEWSPNGRSIAYSTNVDDTSTIYIASTDGTETGLGRALDVGMSADELAWRPPDGSELLIRGESTTGTGLYLVGLDGGDPRPVTDVDGTANDFRWPGWSPDASMFSYHRTFAVHVSSADGTDDRVLTSSSDSEAWARWSPAGDQLVLQRQLTDKRARLVVVPADGSGPGVPTGPAFPSTASAVYTWSPDGTKILALYSGQAAPWLLDPNGGEGEQAPWEATSTPTWQRLAP